VETVEVDGIIDAVYKESAVPHPIDNHRQQEAPGAVYFYAHDMRMRNAPVVAR
jgi:hypothetical protein